MLAHRGRLAGALALLLLIAASLAFIHGPARALASSLSVLAAVRPVWMWLAAGCFLAALVCSACTWRCALALCDTHVSVAESISRYGVGSLLNSLLPARVGDAARIGLFAQTLPAEGRLTTAAGVAGAISAARGLVFCVPVGFAVATGLLPVIPVLVLAATVLAAAAGATLLARRLGRHSSRIDQLLVGVRALARSPLGSLRLLAWVAAAAFARLAAAAAVGTAVGLHAPLAAALISIPAAALATVIPLTPGSIGVTSGAVALALHSQGVGLSAAVAVGIAFHAVETAAGLSFGAVGVLTLGARPRLRRRRSLLIVTAAAACVVGAAVVSSLA